MVTVTREIAFAVSIKASPREVWNALVDPMEIPKWHNYEHVELDALNAGGRFRFLSGGEPEDLGEILEVESERKLIYRWTSSEPEPTKVEYELRPTSEGTLLRFRNTGFENGASWDQIYEADFRGWVDITLKLKRIVEDSFRH